MKLKKEELTDYIKDRREELKHEKIKDKNTGELRDYRPHEIVTEIKKNIADNMEVTIRTGQRLYNQYNPTEEPISLEMMALKDQFDNTQMKCLCYEQERIAFIEEDKERVEEMGRLQDIRNKIRSI
tara:strand:+ start:220 stop:597 length:378 start_codon:yes stop_codon:yes gene_type:complete